MHPITVTVDVEDHRPDDEADLRFPELTRRISTWLRSRGWRSTFFVVGEEAERHPDLVGELVAAGHEVGLHGYQHRPLAELGAAAFAAHLERGRRAIEAASGAAVAGFRAPQFSLTKETLWAPEVLWEAGFSYSSSVLPSANPLHGFPGAPRHPFRWPSGLVELPAPVVGVGPLRVPIGGLYLRVVPEWAWRRLVRADLGPVPWLYVHPYDFDPDEPRYTVRDAPAVLSRLQWRNRHLTRARLETLVGECAGEPLVERLGVVELPQWDPTQGASTSSGADGGVSRSSSSSRRSSATSSANVRDRSSSRDSSQL
jgi:polysaccharide deacetylase family protein (PEP-CTERM system associated)